MTLAHENQDEAPRHIVWDRGASQGPISVFTDIRLREAIDDRSEIKIALLIEPPAVSITHYETARELRGEFTAILTHQRDWAELGIPFRWYPFGGSWIKEWGMFPKSRTISILTSPKALTVGHRLRHEIVKRFGSQIAVFGLPYTHYVPFKHDALRPFRYSIVVENDDSNWWFTEKLIDCFSQGTIPIYWGCDLSDYFNPIGMIPFRDTDELAAILPLLSEDDYIARLDAVKDNMHRAQAFRVAEDWIFKHYPELFGC